MVARDDYRSSMSSERLEVNLRCHATFDDFTDRLSQRIISIDESDQTVAGGVGLTALEALVLEEVGPEGALPSLRVLAQGVARVAGAQGVAVLVGSFQVLLERIDLLLDRLADAEGPVGALQPDHQVNRAVARGPGHHDAIEARFRGRALAAVRLET